MLSRLSLAVLTTAFCLAPSFGFAAEDTKETAVAVADLPKVVSEAAIKALPGLVITEATVEVEDGVTIYDLEGKVGDVEYELEVNAAGKVLETKIDKDDDGDQDDEHEGKHEEKHEAEKKD
jgi:hypothetical protein